MATVHQETELTSETEFIPIDDSTEPATETFNCPICYTDGSMSGLVNPANCTHQICLECYTNIALRSQSPTCPMCRSVYLRTPSPQPPPVSSPITTPQRRPISPNMNSDVMSLLIHNALPEYSYGNIIVDSITDVSRAQIILDLLSN